MKKKDLEGYIEGYLIKEQEDEKAKNTLIHYRHIINMFVSSLPEKNEITKIDFMCFKEKMLEKYKPKTVSNYITIVNKFVKYAEIVTEKGIEQFEFSMLKDYKGNKTLKNIKLQQEASLKEVLEPIDLKRMLRMAKKLEEWDLYYIMKVIAYTGVRAEELKIFTVENLESNYIKVKNKGKIRNVIVPQDLRRDLLKYCKNAGITTGYIFPGKKSGTMLHSTTIYKRLKKLAGQCRGVKKSKVHAHSFRHLFAIKYMEEYGNISELADILGHSSIETTRIYTRTTDKMKRERMERMKY